MHSTNGILLSSLVCAALSGCGADAPQPESGGPRPRPVFDADAEPHVAGKKVIVANGCLRCHSIHLARDAANSKPVESASDLGTVGSDPARNADWFMAFVRRPNSVRPGIRMPAFEGKINETDLRALAEYLASLK